MQLPQSHEADKLSQHYLVYNLHAAAQISICLQCGIISLLKIACLVLF